MLKTSVVAGYVAVVIAALAFVVLYVPQVVGLQGQSYATGPFVAMMGISFLVRSIPLVGRERWWEAVFGVGFIIVGVGLTRETLVLSAVGGIVLLAGMILGVVHSNRSSVAS